MKKDFQQFFRELEAQGYTVTKKRKHVKIVSPKGEIFFAAATPSDHRALENLRQDIKRGRPKTEYKRQKGKGENVA